MGNRTYQITTTIPVPYGESTRTNLGLAVDKMNAIVPLSWLHFTPLAVTPTPPALAYNYQVRSADGRVWNQVIAFANATDRDPTMTFAVGVGWKISEEAQQLAIRALLVEMVVNFGATIVKIDF